MIKRILIVFVLLVSFTLIGTGLYLYSNLGREGSSNLEHWLGEQIVSLLKSYVNPSIEFDTVDYQAPRTLIIDGLRIFEDGESMIDVARVHIDLAEIPKVGQPFLIEQIALTDPRLHLQESEQGQLTRWPHFLKSRNDEEHLAPSSDNESPKLLLSDVLQMRRIAIENGTIEYVPFGDQSKMVLNGLTTVINTNPDTEDPGEYGFDTTIERDDLFTIAAKGDINLDTFLLKIASLHLSTQLDPDNYEIFPPQVQQYLADHDVRGELVVEGSANLQLNDLQSASVDAICTLEDGIFAYGERMVSLDLLTVLGKYQNGLGTLEGDASLMGGRLIFDATDSTKDDQPILVNWEASDIELSRMIRSLKPDEMPLFAGKIGSNGTFLTEALDFPDSIDGDGVLTISEGRLTNIPLLRVVALEFLDSKKKKDSNSGNDRAEMVFKFVPEGLDFSKLTASSMSIEVRGKGKISYEGELDLRCNGGPMEKVQSKLGDFGKILGVITDQLVTYRVTGLIGSPKIDVQPLGIPLGNGSSKKKKGG